MLNNEYCSMHTEHRALHSAHSTEHCKVHSIQCTLYNALCPVCSLLTADCCTDQTELAALLIHTQGASIPTQRLVDRRGKADFGQRGHRSFYTFHLLLSQLFSSACLSLPLQLRAVDTFIQAPQYIKKKVEYNILYKPRCSIPFY